MVTTQFAPIPAVAGGVLIGLAAVLMMGVTGRIAGVSGFVSRLLPPYGDDQTPSRLAFVLGLLAAPALYTLATGAGVTADVTSNVPRIVVAGLLVGFGAVWGSGCTSGHGVCGLARLSTRSLAATATFMLAAVVTLFFSRHVAGV